MENPCGGGDREEDAEGKAETERLRHSSRHSNTSHYTHHNSHVLSSHMYSGPSVCSTAGRIHMWMCMHMFGGVTVPVAWDDGAISTVSDSADWLTLYSWPWLLSLVDSVLVYMLNLDGW